MNKKFITACLFIVLFMSSASNLSAEDLNFDAGSIYISANEEKESVFESRNFDGDYFAGGKIISFSGIADDLYLMGQSINFSGESSGGMIAFGETVELNGMVAKNLHSIGDSVRITGHVLETAFIGADNIVISEDAVLDGTLLSGASSLHIMGQLNNGLLAGAGEIIIDGPVKGDVNVRTGKLTITERGSIQGNLIYGSGKKISAEESARIKGTVKYELKDKIKTTGFRTFRIVASIIFFLAIAVSGLLLLLFPGVKSLFTQERDPRSYGKTLLWGLIPVFIFPVVIMITFPLLPLSIALGLSVFPLMGLTVLFGLALAGQLLFKLFKWENNSIYLQFLLAFAFFVLLVLIPFVKVLVLLAVCATGAGLIISKLFKTDF